MHEHHLRDQVAALIKAKVIKATDEEKALKALGTCWVDNIAVVWSVDDVKDRAREAHKRMSKEHARSILQHMLHHHDANDGINWDVIDANL